MSARRSTFASVLALFLLPAPAVRADKLDKESKKWLEEEVAPIILPEEEKVFRDLKDKSDREEFQRIFWVRRDPDLDTPQNEFQAEYQKVKAEADSRYRAGGRIGSTTDCGRVFILLGEPNEVKKLTDAAITGPRMPEAWTYRDRPGITFAGGQIQITFDSDCQLPQGGRMGDQLARIAEARIIHPNLDYRRGSDGKLTKLVDLLPKPTPAQALLKEPRQEFPIESQPQLLIRGKGGATYLGGLLRGDAASLSVQDEGGRKRVPLAVVAQAVDENGKVAASTEQQTVADVGADGSFLASYSLTLRPGKYTIKVGVLEGRGQKGAVASAPVEVPSFGSGTMAVSDIIVVADVKEQATSDPSDPLAAFFLGQTQLVPRFGNVFAKEDSIQLLALIYDAQTDPATGKASTAARFTILKDGRTLTNSEEQVYDTPSAAPAVGPVPLQGFPPGKYVAQLKVTDKVAQKEVTKEAGFDVKP